MKRLLVPVSLAVFSCGIAAPALAQMATWVNVPPPLRTMNGVPPSTEYGEHHPYAEDFNSYLDEHPDEAQELNKKPGLVRNPTYLSNHPDLDAYLREHPKVASQYEHHPRRFMHREKRYEHSEERYDKRHGIPNP
jgi:hypothetical protein